MESRAERLARNEALFREVNERTREVAESFATPTLSVFCECSQTSCTATISVSLDDYEAVRRHGDRFLLVEGHEDTEIERVVERRGDAVVVEKTGEGADVARRLDPRAE